VCVASCNVKVARKITDRVCAVVGFPHGNALPAVKLPEAATAGAPHGSVHRDHNSANFPSTENSSPPVGEKAVRSTSPPRTRCRPTLKYQG